MRQACARCATGGAGCAEDNGVTAEPVEARTRIEGQDLVWRRGCTPMGDYACQIVLPIAGQPCGVDYCIADIVAALNAENVRTVASCCGHGDESIARIDLEDGRVLHITGHTPNKVTTAAPVGSDAKTRLELAEELLGDLANGFWVSLLDGADGPVSEKMGQRVLNYWRSDRGDGAGQLRVAAGERVVCPAILDKGGAE